jgi:hypothetical protein
MGIQYSKAKVAVDNVVKAGIKVVVNQVQNSASTVDGSQLVNVTGCKNVNISNIKMKQFLKVNFSVLATQEAQTDLKTKIDQAVKAAADAAAKGGWGAQGTDAETDVRNLLDCTQEITTSAVSIFTQNTSLSQAIVCKESEEVTISYIDMEQVADVIASAIVSQGSFNSAMIDIVNKIDALATAKSTGYDPFGIIGLIAIVVIAAIIVLPLGGSLMGVNAAKKLMGSPYFWMGMLGLLSALFTAGLLAEMIGFWPNQLIDVTDKEDGASRKKKINTAVTAISSIGLISSLGGIGAIAYFAIIRPKKRGAVATSA